MTPNPEQPSTKRFRISEDQTASHDPQTNILTPLHQTKLNVSTTPPIASHPQLSSQSDNKSKDPSNIKIHIKDIPTSSDIDIPDNELDPTIFPSNGLILTNDWNPRDEHANLGTSKVFLLDNFSVLKNQTLVFKITVPTDSKRWSINLGPPEMASKIDADNDQTWNNILYHFNPRYGGKKKELVQCDMNDGTWGVTDRRAFSAFSIIPTGNIQLMIQVWEVFSY